MTYKKLTYKETYILSIDPNEDIVKSIENFVKEKGVKSGYIIGIGAVKSARLAHYSVLNKKYTERKIRKPLEMVNITGIITRDKVHLHGTFASQMFKTYSGHIVRAIVSAACEIVIVETKEEVARYHSDKIGLDLLNLK